MDTFSNSYRYFNLTNIKYLPVKAAYDVASLFWKYKCTIRSPNQDYVFPATSPLLLQSILYSAARAISIKKKKCHSLPLCAQSRPLMLLGERVVWSTGSAVQSPELWASHFSASPVTSDSRFPNPQRRAAPEFPSRRAWGKEWSEGSVRLLKLHVCWACTWFFSECVVYLWRAINSYLWRKQTPHPSEPSPPGTEYGCKV